LHCRTCVAALPLPAAVNGRNLRDAPAMVRLPQHFGRVHLPPEHGRSRQASIIRVTQTAASGWHQRWSCTARSSPGRSFARSCATPDIRHLPPSSTHNPFLTTSLPPPDRQQRRRAQPATSGLLHPRESQDERPMVSRWGIPRSTRRMPQLAHTTAHRRGRGAAELGVHITRSPMSIVCARPIT
jgi:hypothetical protein